MNSSLVQRSRCCNSHDHGCFVLLITCANVAGLLLARSVQRQKGDFDPSRFGRPAWSDSPANAHRKYLAGTDRGNRRTLSAVWLVPAIIGVLPQISLEFDAGAARTSCQYRRPGVFSRGLITDRRSFWALFPRCRSSSPTSARSYRNPAAVPWEACTTVSAMCWWSGSCIGGSTARGRRVDAEKLATGAESGPRFRDKTPNLRTLGLAVPEKAYPDGPHQQALAATLSTDIHAIPGVQDVGAVSIVPLSGSGNTSRFDPEATRRRAGGEEYEASTPTVTTNYFDVMRIPLRSGRFFNRQDTEKSTPVVIVNQALVDQVFHGQNPVGKENQLHIHKRAQLCEIIGVVGNENVDRLDARMQPVIYDTFEQSPNTFFSLVVRTQQAPETLAKTVTRKVREIDPQIAISNVASMAQIIHASPVMMLRAYPAYLLAAFAGMALALAVLGIYGLLAYSVVQRRRELGLRLALGAAPSDVRQLVVANGLKLALIGTALGIAGAFAASRVISSLLFEVSQPML